MHSSDAMKKHCQEIPNIESFWAKTTEKFQQKNMTMPITVSTIRRASQQGFPVNRYRLQKVAEKLLQGEGISIFVTGGSETAGQGCTHKWSDQLGEQLRQSLPEDSWGKIKVINGAHGGARSDWFLNHILTFDKDLSHIDLFINEWHFNDGYNVQRNKTTPQMNDVERRKIEFANEEIYRRVSSYPQKPAYVFFDTPPWSDDSLKLSGQQSVHYRVAKEYSIPLLWYVDAVKDSGHVHMYPDGPHAHPSCFPAHELLASVMSGMIHNEMQDVCEQQGVHGEDIPEFAESTFGGCVVKPTFAAFADSKDGEHSFHSIHNSGWSFEEDVKGKPGWIAKAPGAEIVFSIPIHNGDVTIEYLRSYDGLGTTICQVENEQESSTPLAVIKLNGLWDTEASLAQYEKISILEQASGTYNLRCTADANKFKIISLLTC